MKLTEEEKFRKLIDSRNKSNIRKIIERFTNEGKQNLLANQFSDLLRLGFLNELQSTVLWCLQNEQQLEYAILAAGKLSDIPLDMFAKFAEHENIIIKVSSLRAMEYRLRDKEPLQKLGNLFNDLLPKIKAGDNDSMWAGLCTIDGILEFEGKDSAIKILKVYYETLDPKMTFPLREAWERLKILGISMEHKIFENSKPMVPHTWLSRKNPFYVDTSSKRK